MGRKDHDGRDRLWQAVGSETLASLAPWLSCYPRAKRISQLALDAAATGLLDFQQAFGKAVVRDVHQEMLGFSPQSSERLRVRHARAVAILRRRRCELAIDHGIVTLHGPIASGIAVYETKLFATLLIGTSFPDTVLAAMAHRRLEEVIDLPLFQGRNYPILGASAQRFGIVLQFSVPTRALPRAKGFTDRYYPKFPDRAPRQ